MHLFSALFPLLLSSPPVSAAGSRKLRQYHERRAEYARQQFVSNPVNIPEASKPQFLTPKTKKFAVDGAGLPRVSFDIGESYAGLLPIDDTSDRELFFWFVPTTNPAAKDEITIWLNGGPGCSSLDGFFHENGPVVWIPGQYRPVKNTYAWSNLTNMVWIEQPVGTGYTRGTANITNEVQLANQFNGFWQNFVDLFGLGNRKLYITGESYAGQYIPYIADSMLKRKDKKYFDVNGILIYDPSIGYDSITEQTPTKALLEFAAPVFPLNDSTRATIAEMSARCGYDDYLERGLQFPPKGPLGPQPGQKRGCDVFDYAINAIFEINPCFDIYQVGQLCPLLWDTLGFPYSNFFLPAGFDQPYFNRTDVKMALHAPLDVDWMICSDRSVFVGDNDRSLPSGLTGGPLQRVIEKTNNVLVGHGTLDMVLILNGTILTLQNLTWNGKQGFSTPPTKPFYVPYHDDPNMGSIAGAGNFGSWTAERGLTYVSTSLAGHMVPQFQASAAYRQLELLLGRIKSLSEVSAFSTQPGYPQSRQPLGKGTAPLNKG